MQEGLSPEAGPGGAADLMSPQLVQRSGWMWAGLPPRGAQCGRLSGWPRGMDMSLSLPVSSNAPAVLAWGRPSRPPSATARAQRLSSVPEEEGCTPLPQTHPSSLES